MLHRSTRQVTVSSAPTPAMRQHGDIGAVTGASLAGQRPPTPSSGTFTANRPVSASRAQTPPCIATSNAPACSVGQPAAPVHPLSQSDAVSQQQPQVCAASKLHSERQSSVTPTPTDAVLLGPNGAQYYHYKGRTMWFGGNDAEAELTAASQAYMPTHDTAHRGQAAVVVQLPDLLASETAQQQPGKPCATAWGWSWHASRGMVGSCTSRSRTSHKALCWLHCAGARATERVKPRPASADTLLPSPRKHVLGKSLAAVVGGSAGTGRSVQGLIADQHRPYTALSVHSADRRRAQPTRSTASPQASSFSSIANSGAGALMARHDQALLRQDITAVRLLA
jgi:hypothetical protein